MTRTPKDWRQAVERLLREAAYTLRLLPIAGCFPQGYKSNMPDIVRERGESYGWDKARKPKPLPTSRAISNLDTAIQLVAGADLTVMQRDIVWARAARVQWKQIKFNSGHSERHCKRLYSYALAEIVAYLIATKQKHMSRFRASRLGRFAA